MRIALPAVNHRSVAASSHCSCTGRNVSNFKAKRRPYVITRLQRGYTTDRSALYGTDYRIDLTHAYMNHRPAVNDMMTQLNTQAIPRYTFTSVVLNAGGGVSDCIPSSVCLSVRLCARTLLQNQGRNHVFKVRGSNSLV